MTVLFMPDISGFTSFVKEVELRHSKHIITELLELLIKVNNDNLKLAEIEGDALFYYQSEDKIHPRDLIAEINNMYEQFHAHLNLYRYKRVCNCGACSRASDLKIKFIVHIGETDFIELNNSKKPFGPEVITVHRLLKNKIEEQEYIVFSQDYWVKHEQEIQSMLGANFNKLSERFDVGDYSYTYYSLKKNIPRLEQAKFPQLKSLKSVSVERIINTDPNDLFQFVVDLSKRVEWNPGLDELRFDNKLNNIDSMHTCVINGQDVNVKTVFANTETDHLIYVEETKDVPIIDCFITVFTITPFEDISKIEVKGYLKSDNIFGKIASPLISRKVKKNLSASFDKLEKSFS